jgi:O-antigen ligase
VQAFTGVSLGGRMGSDRLSGVFGDDNLKLGGVVAALSPLLLAHAQHRYGLLGVFVAGVLLAGVILLAGARAAWLVYGLVLLGWCLRPFAVGAGRALLLGLALVLAGMAVGYGAYRLSPHFADRLDRTWLLTSPESGDLDHALAGRLPIWRTAAAMAQAHPINGVGVRGFRHAYLDHAAADDPWRRDGGAMHPHQLLLELSAETGVIGLVGWLLGALLLLRVAWRAPPARRLRAWPPLLALAATCFPFNTHYAVYSSWWGLFLWWLIALAVAALYVDEAAP